MHVEWREQITALLKHFNPTKYSMHVAVAMKGRLSHRPVLPVQCTQCFASLATEVHFSSWPMQHNAQSINSTLSSTDAILQDSRQHTTAIPQQYTSDGCQLVKGHISLLSVAEQFANMLACKAMVVPCALSCTPRLCTITQKWLLLPSQINHCRLSQPTTHNPQLHATTTSLLH